MTIGGFVFFYEIEHPLVHLRHNERLRIENKKFVFRFGICPSCNNCFKKQGTSFESKGIEREKWVVEEHSRLLCLDISVNPSLTAIAFVFNDAIKSGLFIGVATHHAHFHFVSHFRNDFAHHGDRSCNFFLMRREERAFHVAPPSGPFRERCACGNAIARGIFHHKLQALPLNQAFGQDIARC